MRVRSNCIIFLLAPLVMLAASAVGCKPRTQWLSVRVDPPRAEGLEPGLDVEGDALTLKDLRDRLGRFAKANRAAEVRLQATPGVQYRHLQPVLVACAEAMISDVRISADGATTGDPGFCPADGSGKVMIATIIRLRIKGGATEAIVEGHPVANLREALSDALKPLVSQAHDIRVFGIQPEPAVPAADLVTAHRSAAAAGFQNIAFVSN